MSAKNGLSSLLMRAEKLDFESVKNKTLISMMLFTILYPIHVFYNKRL